MSSSAAQLCVSLSEAALDVKAAPGAREALEERGHGRKIGPSQFLQGG